MKSLIRYAKTKDAPMISLLGKMAFYEMYEHVFEDKNSLTDYCDMTFSVEKMKFHLSKKGNTFWLVHDGVLPIGYLELKRDSSSHGGSSGFITFLHKIYLFQEYWNKGIGQKLFDKMMQESKRLHAGKVLLFVLKTNAREIQFYSQNSFIKVGERLMQMGQETFEFILMEKRLNG